VVFHTGAGTLYDRANRMSLLSAVLARVLGIDASMCSRAALLAKADLLSGLVGEFPELQGVMGRHYALHDGEDESIANAIRDHYKPQGPNDRVPSEPLSVVVSLADKIDSVVTLWNAGEKPTGSKDPFGMRRSALGIIRLVLENRLRVSLFVPMRAVLTSLRMQASGAKNTATGEVLADSAVFQELAFELLRDAPAVNAPGSEKSEFFAQDRAIAMEVLGFLADRLKVALRDQGVRHDLIGAVFSLGGEDDLVRLVSRVRALESFLNTEDGANLLAAYRRAVNILRIEEKRDGHTFNVEPYPNLLEAREETDLFAALAASRERISGEIRREHFSEAMICMAGLREPVDAFFNKVTVNAADPALRENRLRLLACVRDVLHTVADFSRIEG
jgi:glycyl-tRNA synthetase beta chain